jgi:hypothetical protein
MVRVTRRNPDNIVFEGLLRPGFEDGTCRFNSRLIPFNTLLFLLQDFVETFFTSSEITDMEVCDSVLPKTI